MQEWAVLGARADGGDAARTTRYVALPPKGILNSPSVTKMDYWSINPYVGCEFGCAYCYARDTHRWTVERAAKGGASDVAAQIAALPPAEAFERNVIVKQGAAELLAQVLPRARLGGRLIMIGTATDPYQPAERRFRLTRSLLETFLAHEGMRIGIISKSALIARDAELLARLSQRHEVTVNVSLASVNAQLLRAIEPRTPTPRARLRSMRTLADAGVQVGLLAAPILPGITDDRPGLLALLKAVKDAGASYAMFGSLRMNAATRATLIPWLEENRPDLAAEYARHYGDRLAVSLEYARALEKRFAELRAEAGIPEERERHGVGAQGDLWD